MAVGYQQESVAVAGYQLELVELVGDQMKTPEKMVNLLEVVAVVVRVE